MSATIIPIAPLLAVRRVMRDERLGADRELACYVTTLYRLSQETQGSDHRQALLQTVAAVLEDAVEVAIERGDVGAIRETVAGLRRVAGVLS